MSAHHARATNDATAQLPVVDLSLLDGNGGGGGDPEVEARVLSQWNDAFRKHGFCYLTSSSHGLAPLYRRVEREGIRFFGLTPEEKSEFDLRRGYGRGGYVRPGVEKVAASSSSSNGRSCGGDDDDDDDVPDPVESLCVHSGKAEHVPPFCREEVQLDVPYKYGGEFKRAVQELWKGLESVLEKIMRLSAKALQLPDAENFFKQYYKPGSNFLRLAHYVHSGDGSNKGSNTTLRYGEHTDYQGFTLLWRNRSNGLQCLDTAAADGADTYDSVGSRWIDVPVLQSDPDALVVNAGDLIQRWTNDYWISNVHRVVKEGEASDEKEGEDLLSVVFFTGPERDTAVRMLPSPLFSHQEPKYDVVTAGEHLKRKLEPTSTTSTSS